MENVGSWGLRKKNINDPLANPVSFFKADERPKDSKKLLNLGHFEKELKSKTDNHRLLFKTADEVKRRPSTSVKTGSYNKDLASTKAYDKHKKFPRVSYNNNWKTRIKKLDSNNNPNRDDF